MKQMHFL